MYSLVISSAALVGIEPLQLLDHPVARGARESQSGALVVEIGEEVGRHGVQPT